MPKIITISGKARHGKDTFASFLEENLNMNGYNTYVYHYADPVKMCATNYFNWDGKKDNYGRTLLQNIGTDRARARDENTWVNIGKNIIENVFHDAEYVIIPDARFPNEIDCWEDLITIKVVRENFENDLNETQRLHASETSLDDYVFDLEVHATTLSDLMESSDVISDYIINSRGK